MGEPLNHIHQGTKSARLIAVCKRSFIETQVKVWENEKLKVELQRARSASDSTLFQVLPNFHECSYNVWEHSGKNVFYFVYKITRIENQNVEIVFFIKE